MKTAPVVSFIIPTASNHFHTQPCYPHTMTPLSLLLISDDPLARAGLALLLSDDPTLAISDQLTSADLLTSDLALAEVVIWDIGWAVDEDLPDFGDIGLPIVALISATLSPDDTAVSQLWSAGVTGLLPRDARPEQIAAAAHAAAQGLTVIDPAFTAALRPPTPPDDTAVPNLTPREQEVLSHLAEGLTNKAIASQLDISDHTVKFHVNAIMTKLNAQSRTNAVVRATRLGLLTL